MEKEEMTDEIRKAAEDAATVIGDEFGDEWFFSKENPDYKDNMNDVINTIVDVILEDRKRRDDLESMLVELAKKSNWPNLKICPDGWTVERYCKALKERVDCGRWTTPVAAARAALDEMKGKEGE
jgi:hypothetical protein